VTRGAEDSVSFSDPEGLETSWWPKRAGIGRKIILPPQFESQRAQIEQRLTPPGPRPA
jgi:hypothetical protein